MEMRTIMKSLPSRGIFFLWLLTSCISWKLQAVVHMAYRESIYRRLTIESTDSKAADGGLEEQVKIQMPRAPSLLYPQILKPAREDGIDVFFYFICGAFIEPERYLSFLETLQAKAEDLRLWIAIMKLSLDTKLVEDTIDEVLSKAQSLGFPSDGRLFLGGHSAGGIVAVQVASKRALGLILIGASCRRNNDLLQYPIPVLTVIGERDGQMGYPSAALDIFRIANVEAAYTKEHTYYYKPVVTIPGMNHVQCADGKTPNFDRGDLVAEIPLEQAHAETATALAAFLQVTTAGITSTSSKNLFWRDILQAKVDGNLEKKNFGKVLYTQSHGVEEKQVQVAAGSSLTTLNVTVVHHNLIANFNASRPFVIGGKIVIPIYTQPLSGSANTLYNLWVKFRSREAVLEDHELIGPSSAEAISTAREFNERTFRKALDLVSDEVEKKYLKEGLQLRFVEDLVLESSQKWDESDVVVGSSADDCRLYECRSPVYRTAEGLNMKLITLGRAMNWIYEDSFRPQQKY
ncbi:hypothetical protein R1sor_003978 [Riccia sorocarpa]|uniref:Alpha/beta hydrolase fold-5 domain-containing protein n=1 Tax=Riccia sorocarpa TaxID=122646 RepID=A0ABD3H521_9MARC